MKRHGMSRGHSRRNFTANSLRHHKQEFRESDAWWHPPLMDLVEILQALWDWVQSVLRFLDETLLK